MVIDGTGEDIKAYIDESVLIFLQCALKTGNQYI